MPSAGSYEAAVVNGKIYVFGSKVNYEYDPAADTWAVKTPMLTSRNWFSVAACEGKIYVFGGSPVTEPPSEQPAVGLNEVYDPAIDTWETRTAMPTNRTGMEANAVNGKIYLMGGTTDGSRVEGASTLNEVYDPATDSWTTATPMPYFAAEIASVALDKKIYLIGGQDSLGWNRNQIYNTETDTWSEGAPIPFSTTQAHAGATTGVKAPKKIYVMGGLEPKSFVEGLDHNFVYDIQTDTWSTGVSLPTARINPAVAVVDELVYVIAGVTELHETTAVVELYTPFLFAAVPAVSVVSPHNETYASSEVPLTFSISEPTLSLSYSLDGRDSTITGNTTLANLSLGVHSITVYAWDTVGNVGKSETIIFTIAPFLTALTVTIAVAAVVGVGLVVYFKKRGRMP